MGPYASVWADICTESIPEALGSLWDASRLPKTSKNRKNAGFRGLGAQVAIPACSPYLPLEAVSNKVNGPMLWL